MTDPLFDGDAATSDPFWADMRRKATTLATQARQAEHDADQLILQQTRHGLIHDGVITPDTDGDGPPATIPPVSGHPVRDGLRTVGLALLVWGVCAVGIVGIVHLMGGIR